jgi:hypothetical protein
MPDSASTMGIIGVVFGIVFLISIFILVLSIIYNKLRRSKLSIEDLKFDKIREIYSDLKKNKVPNPKKVIKFAYELETRVLVFEILEKFNKSELFPRELLTIEKASESYLSNCLYQDDEHETFPDHICYVGNSELNQQLVVFKFKSDEPHIYANRGWMYGYVVYNGANNKPYEVPALVISNFDDRLLTLDEIKLLI